MITLDTTTGRIVNPGESLPQQVVRFDPNTQRYDPATKQVVPRNAEDHVPPLVAEINRLKARISALEAAMGIRVR